MSASPRPKRKTNATVISDGVENIVPSGIEDPLNKKAKISTGNKRGSALPRFQAQRGNVAELKKEKITMTESSIIKIEEKNEIVEAEEEKKTPLKSIMNLVNNVSNSVFGTTTRSAIKEGKEGKEGKAPTSTKRRTQKSTPQTPPKVVESLFDSTLTVNEEKMYDIVGHLKLKSKWDMKEKATKQALVITDLRTALKTTLAEVKVLRAKCCEAENIATTMIHNTHIELQETNQMVSERGSTEKQLEQDLAVVRAERDLLEKSLSSNSDAKTQQVEKLENENNELSNKIKELEVQQIKLMEKMAGEDTLRANYENDSKVLKEELMVAKQDIVEANANAHLKYEQVSIS